MNSYKKILAICLLQILFYGLKAQNKEILKSFINKNDIALRSIQKQVIKSGTQESELLLSELINYQSIAVNEFDGNPGKSADIAYFVRVKCSEFLKDKATSTEYLKFSDKETNYFSSHKSYVAEPSTINSAEMQKLKSLNIKDPHVFENLKTRID